MADLNLIRPDSFTVGLDILPDDLKDNFLQLINRSNLHDNSISTLESLLGTSILELITGNNLNSGFKGYYRFDNTTTNNPYGVGFVLGSQYGATNFVQVIYSITQRRLIYRVSTNSGATWVDATEILTASSIRRVPTPTWTTGTTFNLVVAGLPLTRTNSVGATITLPVGTYNVDLNTLGLNGLSQVSFNTATRHYVYMAQKRETVVPTVGLVSGLLVSPTNGLTSINVNAVDYDLYQITGLDFVSETFGGATRIPPSAFLNLNQATEFTKPGDNNSLFASMNIDGTTSANLTGTYTRTGTLVTANVTAHGHIAGHRIYAQHTTGGALNGWYEVNSVIDQNTFTYNTVASGTITSSNLTLPRRQIRKSLNVQSVPNNSSSTADMTVNLLNSYGSTNYSIVGSGQSNVLEQVAFVLPNLSLGVKTALYFNFLIAGTATGTLYESPQINIAVF